MLFFIGPMILKCYIVAFYLVITLENVEEKLSFPDLEKAWEILIVKITATTVQHPH